MITSNKIAVRNGFAGLYSQDQLQYTVSSAHFSIYKDTFFFYKGTKQRRSEDYTGMQRGQARFFTYYQFLALRRHCSVGFRCVLIRLEVSRDSEKIYRKKIVKW
jgi:hypothetical protein